VTPDVSLDAHSITTVAQPSSQDARATQPIGAHWGVPDPAEAEGTAAAPR